MDKTYPTPAAFDRAIKKAVSGMGGDPGELYRQVLRDRFMCRVFSDDNDRFVLKGGSGMLARIPDARATKDLDFAVSETIDVQAVLVEMKRIAAIDLGDWCKFQLTKSEEGRDENGYSRLHKLRFATFIGSEEKDPILIDISLDCVTTLPPERITPANRIEIVGVETCDYLVYPLPDQLADKLCAIMELQPNGYPSSRMKDLVDVVIYLMNKSFNFDQLKCAIDCECLKRGMEIPQRFEAPESWANRFKSFAKNNGVPEKFVTFEDASRLASRFFNPALANEFDEMAIWNNDLLQWTAGNDQSNKSPVVGTNWDNEPIKIDPEKGYAILPSSWDDPADEELYDDLVH